MQVNSFQKIVPVLRELVTRGHLQLELNQRQLPICCCSVLTHNCLGNPDLWTCRWVFDHMTLQHINLSQLKLPLMSEGVGDRTFHALPDKIKV